MDTREPSQPPKRRWSWRQYSVSTLLIVVTIVCVFLALVVVPAERQRRAVAALRELRVGVQYDFASQRRAPPGPRWLRRIIGVDYFAEVSDSPYRGYSARDVPRHATDEACVHLGTPEK